MDFLEDLFDLGDRKRRKNGGLFHDDDHHDDHGHYQQYPTNAYPQAPANSQFPVNQQFPSTPAASLQAVVCRKCSTTTLHSAKFCHGCGAALGALQNCASCGSRLPANAPFCPQCGYNNN